MKETETTEKIKMIVTEQLRSARKLRNLNIRRAASLLYISPSYLSQIENGKKNISLNFIFKASKVYQVSVDVLLGRDEIPGRKIGKKKQKFIAQFYLTQTN